MLWFTSVRTDVLLKLRIIYFNLYSIDSSAERTQTGSLLTKTERSYLFLQWQGQTTKFISNVLLFLHTKFKVIKARENKNQAYSPLFLKHSCVVPLATGFWERVTVLWL